MRRRAALAAALACSLAACSGSKAPALDAGAVRDGVYRNDYFRLSVPVPFGWTVEKPPRADRFLDGFITLLAAGDRSMTDAKAIPARKHFLLRALSDQTFLAIAAAEVGFQPQLNWGTDCLKRVPVILNAGGTPYRITQPPHPTVIGGLNFDGMGFAIRLADGELHQRVYATVRWGYALVFVVGSPSPEGLKQGEAALAKASFAPKNPKP